MSSDGTPSTQCFYLGLHVLNAAILRTRTSIYKLSYGYHHIYQLPSQIPSQTSSVSNTACDVANTDSLTASKAAALATAPPPVNSIASNLSNPPLAVLIPSETEDKIRA
jgi:hypothetical protein